MKILSYTFFFLLLVTISASGDKSTEGYITPLKMAMKSVLGLGQKIKVNDLSKGIS
jgi:hypothetical protein